MKNKTVDLILIFGVLIFTMAMAVNVTNSSGYTKFDRNPNDIFGLYYGSTRAMSFGGAYYVNGNDLGAFLFNPAQIMTIPNNGLEISGIIANKPLRAISDYATITSEESGTQSKVKTFALKTIDSSVFYSTFMGAKLGDIALLYSKPYFIPVYKTTEAATILSPKGNTENYDQFAQYDDFGDFNIYSTVLGMGNKILAGALNITYFNGPIVRYVRGHESGSDNYWYRKEKIYYNGYTVDAGAILNFFLVKAGIVYKNLLSDIVYEKTGAWADTYDGGHYSTDATSSDVLINSPYLVGSLGADIGVIKAEVAAYNLDLQALQEGTINASGIAVGAQFNFSLLQLRMGARMPFSRFMDFVNDPSQLNYMLFDPDIHLSFGVGMGIGPFQADIAFGKNLIVQQPINNKMNNYWSLNTGFNLLF